ncbi:ABC transporter ATP-binding protein [Enorma phocaeensis]|uniref:ABC transporter ATP-binding protein n=1 Tax=Enorma phocaeensis TaxID=1871019 RepID=UPI0019584ED7|nr:ABC transporter ATP-binding protein [Enorma phocaeensis]MBM6953802.1 ABC transporter ATP-binding protein [Enorma phocaeensis]
MANASAPAICVRGLTKDYGRGRGVFDVSLEVSSGEVLGFLGPNGAGKTVTMRHFMGFIRAQGGTVEVLGHDCFRDRPLVQVHLGYLPGESSCMREMTARSFLNLMAGMRGLRDRSRMRELADVFELDLDARIGGMSKGNRQKVAIVTAFMARPDVLLLDEPTSGLDPLMQERFLDLVAEERARGAAVLLSSHIFEEIGRACDRVAFIRAGRVVMTCTMDEVRSMRGRGYTVEFANVRERSRWELAHGNEPAKGGARVVELRGVRDVNALIRELSSYDVAEVTSRAQTLEELFLHLYEGDEPSGRK